MNLSKQIKKYRATLALSQEELSEKLFVSRQTISNWENGHSYPDIHNLLLLSALFDVSLDKLVKGDVETMKDWVSHSEMDKYTKVMIVFIVLAMLSIGPSLLLPGYWFFLPPFILWLVGMYGAIKVEKIKKSEDVQTYKEIIAFMENKDIEAVRKKRNKRKDKQDKRLIVLVFCLVAGIIALLSIWLFTIV